MPFPIRHRRQKVPIHQCHSQVRTASIAPEHLRCRRKQPKGCCRYRHREYISFLHPAKQRKQEAQVHKIISAKQQPLFKLPRGKMEEPPFHHLRARRIIPEFRRHIGITPGKAVQIKQGLYIRCPEIIIIPPADCFSAYTNRNHHDHGKGRKGAGREKFAQGKAQNISAVGFRFPVRNYGIYQSRCHYRHCRIIGNGQYPEKRKYIKEKDENGTPHRKRFHHPYSEFPCNTQ